MKTLAAREAFAQYKQTLMDEFNDLHIDGCPRWKSSTRL